MPILGKCRNGNYQIEIHDDGTKIRDWDDGVQPIPEYPESIDMKITDKCHVGCKFCHEQSTPEGLHADPRSIHLWFRDYEGCMEIALGGGDITTHPGLRTIVQNLHERGCIPNATLSASRFYDPGSTFLDCAKYLYGIGVTEPIPGDVDGVGFPEGESKIWVESVLDRVVVHLIAGVHHVSDSLKYSSGVQLLVLGFKKHGRGKSYYSDEQERKRLDNILAEWKFRTPTLLTRGNVSFDNLALEQLSVKDHVPPDVWEKSYMGDDGHYTMYIDAVKREYAASSTSERHPCGDLTVRQMFANIRQQKGLPVWTR